MLFPVRVTANASNDDRTYVSNVLVAEHQENCTILHKILQPENSEFDLLKTSRNLDILFCCIVTQILKILQILFSETSLNNICNIFNILRYDGAKYSS